MKREYKEGLPERLILEDAITMEQIGEFFNFADPILGVEWGDEGPPDEYAPVYIAAHPDFTKVIVIKDQDGKIIAGTKVKLLDRRSAVRLGLDNEKYANKKGILLEYTAIEFSYQNKKLLQSLTDKRIEWGKEQGADYACTELEISKSISIWTKLRDGFVLVNIMEPGEGLVEPYFVAVKSLVEENNEQVGGGSLAWREIEVSENIYPELKRLFEDGWVGIDIKGIEGSPSNLNNPWTLVLEKKI